MRVSHDQTPTTLKAVEIIEGWLDGWMEVIHPYQSKYPFNKL